MRILPLGISHPVAYDLLLDTNTALIDVAKINDALFAKLDADRFFYCVRPYYKPHRVGLNGYRGPNAGGISRASTKSTSCLVSVARTIYPIRNYWWTSSYT